MAEAEKRAGKCYSCDYFAEFREPRKIRAQATAYGYCFRVGLVCAIRIGCTAFRRRRYQG